MKQIRNLNISKHKRNALWNFSPTCELRIFSRRHVDRRQMLSTSTADYRLSITLKMTAGVIQNLFNSGTAYHSPPT